MACNTLTQQGVPVTANVVGEASPNTPQGGELVPGTYTFTAQTFYVPGAQPNTTTLPPQTVVISAGSSQWLMKDQDGTDIRFTAKLTMNGTAFTRNITCSSPSTADPFSYKYSATPTTFTMFSDLGGGSVEQTFTMK